MPRRSREGGPRPTTALLLVGPDGSGKSTLLEHVASTLDKRGVSWNRVYVRPGRILPSRGDNRARVEGHQPVDPHELAQYSPLMGVIKAVLLCLDGVSLRVDRARAKASSGVLLIERGLYDIYVDPIRYGLDRVPRWLLLRLARWGTVADRIVVCRCPAETAFARKGETSAVAIAAQYAAWDEAESAQHRVPFINLDTSAPIDAAALSLVTEGTPA